MNAKKALVLGLVIAVAITLAVLIAGNRDADRPTTPPPVTQAQPPPAPKLAAPPALKIAAAEVPPPALPPRIDPPSVIRVAPKARPTSPPLVVAPPPVEEPPVAQPVPPTEPIGDPNARAALRLVGADPVAEQYWVSAINNPNLSANERKNLIEDLNEDGLSDPKHPGPQDVPLIVNRMKLIEQLAPNAMDQVNANAFAEAYKYLQNMLDGQPAQ